MRGRLIAWAGLMILSSCQYEAKPISVAAYNVYSSYDAKLPGKYLLFVDADKLAMTAKPDGLTCSAHGYEVDLRSSFTGSVERTLGNLVGEIERVDRPQGREEIRAVGARGMIIVRGEQLDASLEAKPGFLSADMDSKMEISASIVVDGRSGRLLGTTVSGSGRGRNDAGTICEGGAKSISKAGEQAMKDVMGRLGEALVNSERVRAGM